MSGELWIGIDGGGTKTIAVIGDKSGHLLAAAKGSSGNLTAISTEQLYTLLNELINQLLIKTGAALTDVEMVYAAMAGADRQAEQQKIYDAFKHSPVLEKLKIQSDIHAPLAAGTWGREGTLLIAGTGAIIFGYEQQKTLWQIEHIRWNRYHFMNNWDYAEKRDNPNRKHHLLVPFDTLSAVEQEKDADAYIALEELLD